MKNFTDIKFTDKELRAVQSITDRYEILISDIWNSSTKRMYAEPRQVIMVFLKFMFSNTLVKTALFFEYDYTAVCRSRNNFCNLFKTDKAFRVRIESVFADMDLSFEEREKFLNNVFQPTQKQKPNENKKRVPA